MTRRNCTDCAHKRSAFADLVRDERELVGLTDIGGWYVGCSAGNNEVAVEFFRRSRGVPSAILIEELPCYEQTVFDASLDRIEALLNDMKRALKE